ncbi:hypothetical protein [Edaphocola aurantiacus]|uniref:hypothetical protein n=1 Tax=Edaphocola aurantiacus TaxID=2601682 RepID=UPI001C94D2A0|nr:hypothetical protein [Edaphocola aurantiacus]
MKILTGAKILGVISVLHIGFTSCDSVQQDANRGSIILGDPATIVTETDTQFLGDIVMDLEEKELAPAPATAKDTFHNVEMAKQLAAQQKKDSAAALAAREKPQAKEEAPKKLSRAEQRAQKRKEEEEKRKEEEAARKKKHSNTRKSGNKKIAQKETTRKRR